MAAAFVMLTFACSFAAKKTTINKVTYFHPPTYKYAFDKLFHGVDVSQWQGSINWKKAKRNGIDFAIIRCGYTSLNRFRFGEDSWFRSNYKRAKKAGVSVGVYYYACATSKKEARKEANYVISILKNSGAKALQLPVVMDYEFGPGRANNHFNRLVKNRGRKYAANVYTENAKAFLNRIRAAGYDSMFYSYRSLIDPEISGAYRFNMDKINGNRQYRFWLAQYSKKNSYAESLEIWQYTSTGKVKGISGNVDRNFWYYPLTGVKTRPGTKSVRKCKVVLSKKNFLYDGTAKIPKITVRYNGKKLVRNRDYTVSFMDNARIGVAYALIHGKGNYSNETSRTFNIKKDPNMVFKPSKIRGVDVDMNVKDREIEMTWAKSVNATRYQVLYKINGDDEWNKKIVQKRRFRLTDLKRGSYVSIKVRAQNVGKKQTKSTDYCETRRLFLRKTDSVARILKGDRMKVTWNAKESSRGDVKYIVTSDCVRVNVDRFVTDKDHYTIKGEHRYCYEVWVRPILKRDGVTYYGSKNGTRSHLFLVTGNIKKLTAKEKGFKVKYNFVRGIGNPRYRIFYARNSKLRNAESVTRPQKKTTCTVKGLKSGKNYYVAVQPYKNLWGHLYLGVRGDVEKVRTK